MKKMRKFKVYYKEELLATLEEEEVFELAVHHFDEENLEFKSTIENLMIFLRGYLDCDYLKIVEVEE